MNPRNSAPKFDYGRRAGERRKMANYLRLRSCRSLSPKQLFEMKVRRRRWLVAGFALTIATIGTYYVFF